MRKKLYEMVNKNKGYYSLISIDMNDLKIINDNKGHAEGDKALVTCANIIRDTLPINADIFRMGGDEFVILYRTTDKNEVELLVNRIVVNIKRTNYSIAIGYSIKNLFKTFEEALVEADEAMYRSKNEYRKKQAK